jgi:hypothetical protein
MLWYTDLAYTGTAVHCGSIVERRLLVLLCPYIPTYDTIQENSAENFVMNALDSKWDTQKLGAT